MTFIRGLFAELFGLFVDDGSLAILSLCLVAVVAALVKLTGLPALLGAALLILGSLTILSWSVYRATARR